MRTREQKTAPLEATVQIRIRETRTYQGLGFLQSGEYVRVAREVGDQLVAQNLAEYVLMSAPMAPVSKEE